MKFSHFLHRSSRLILVCLIAAIFFAYIIFETYTDFSRLRALLGVVVFVSLAYSLSAHRKQVIWRPVVCGATLQFLLGVLFIRWPVGRRIFECFGNKVAQFLGFGKDGAEFVYGPYLVQDLGVFAFAVLTTIYFFSLCISVCYYIG
jgi:pyrimidine nucleoside transport protein